MEQRLHAIHFYHYLICIYSSTYLCSEIYKMTPLDNKFLSEMDQSLAELETNNTINF